MKKRYNVGILGATGTVGQRFATLLKNHPWFNVKILAASASSKGKTFEEAVADRWVMNEEIPEDFKDFVLYDAVSDAQKIAEEVDFVFCAVSLADEQTGKLEEQYAKFECPVISNNSAHRFTPDVPMIIPEINPQHAEIIKAQRKRLGTQKGFVAVKSNCSLQCYVPALHPLLDLNLTKILACTYQSISGSGKTFETWPEMNDNIIPFICGEEEKSELEPLKIWGKIKDDRILNAKNPNITTQCLRVPVSNGHMAAVFASFEKKLPLSEIINKWNNFEAVSNISKLPSSPKRFITYFKEQNRPQIKLDRNNESGMGISIGRLRSDSQYDIKFICMSHNTIRGAAGGAILMAELLCDRGYI